MSLKHTWHHHQKTTFKAKSLRTEILTVTLNLRVKSIITQLFVSSCLSAHSFGFTSQKLIVQLAHVFVKVKSHNSSVTNPTVFSWPALHNLLLVYRLIPRHHGIPSWQLTVVLMLPPPQKNLKITVYWITCIHHYGFILHSLKKGHCISMLD